MLNYDENTAYVELVQELLNCPQDEEQALLATRSELVNENLVMNLLAVAKMLMERDGQEAESTVGWLVGFAQDLAGKLGLDIDEVGQDEGSRQEDLDFLNALIKAEQQDESQVQVLFSENIERLTPGLGAIMQWYTKQIVATRPEDAEGFVALIENIVIRLSEFPFGNRAQNIEIVLAGYEAVLMLRTKENYPEKWAMTQNNLGASYSHRIRGDRAENTERSIICYEAALEVYSKEDFPIDWAMIQNNLANSYQNRIRGDRVENTERSIICYEAALEVYSKEDFPIDWATTQNNLANSYQNRIRGDKAENMEQSIVCYEAALEVRTKEDFPIQWATTQNNLANAYGDRIRGDKAENMEESIASYKAALEVYTKEHLPIQWAMTQNNLANSYQNRIRGDKAENIEQSIACYQAALEVRTKEDFPIDWAMTQNNLANSYQNRIRGYKAENIEQSIACYQAALEVYTKEDFPIDWAMTQNNLANSYQNRIRGVKAENMELSITCYQAALEVRTKEDFPIDWATTQNNLANSYSDRIRGDRAENMEQSIACYKAALEIYTKEDFPIDWAMTQNNLANSYSDRIRGDKAENMEELIASYKAALEIRTPQSLPIECLQTSRNLGNAYFVQCHWQNAIEAYETAIGAAEISRSWSVNDTERQRVLQSALSVYENAIQCAVNLKNYRQAIEYTERFRSRQLVELMASKDLYHDAQVPAEIQQYLCEYQHLNEKIQNLREGGEDQQLGITASRSIADLHRNTQEIDIINDRKQELYNKIRAYDPVLAGGISIAPISSDEIHQLIPDSHTAFLTFYSTNDDTHIFILKKDQEPELFTCKGQGRNELQQWLVENWLKPYRLNSSAWQAQMPAVLAEISQRLKLQDLIANHLDGIQEIVIIPHLLLHQIPFAALPINESNKSLGEQFTLSFIPSCRILQYCQQRQPINTCIQGIVEDADDSLIGARYEGQKIAEIYNVLDADRLRGKTQATITNYLQLLGRVNHLHSSHHAISRLDAPLESALILSDGRITLGNLLMGARYPQLDEVVLSACESHFGAFTLTDDVATLTTGFLCIGARSVMSTLWNISDLVTALFDIFYHQERREGYRPAMSLKRAQIRLQNMTGKEFEQNHSQELNDFYDSHLPPTLHEEIDRVTGKLKAIDMDKEEERWDKVNAELLALVRFQQGWSATIKAYCKADRPFADPYYWAGFICQGMA
jgi:CHAT domain-containing protein